VIRFQTTNSLSTTIKFHNGRHRVGVEGNIALARIGFGSGTPHSKRAVDEVNAVKSGSDVSLFSRRRKSLNRQFPSIVEPLADLPDGTVVDGELVAIDDDGRPNFHLLQNFRAEATRIHYYIFDLLCCEDRDLTRLPLIERRVLLKSLVMIHETRIRISDYVEAGATELLAAVREQHLEGIIGKRKDKPLPARKTKWRVDQVSRESRTGIGDWRLHSGSTRH